MKKLLILSFILISFNAFAYNRADYGSWIDADRDCQDTRQEVLIRDSNIYSMSKNNCVVNTGVWIDKYTGQKITNPQDLDIDHIVPLAEADKSGASKWSKKDKVAFANDLDNLIAVSIKSNRAKGDKPPHKWMPSQYRCEYLTKWLAIKKKYSLKVFQSENNFIQGKLGLCS